MVNTVFLFCIYSFFGWVLEVIFFYIKTKKIQKRGILSGPYCPLYGFSIAVCTEIIENTDNLFLQFLICALICTAFEFITAIIFDKILKKPMWDYSGVKFNINGYICLKYSVIWGILATISIHLLNPVLLQQNSVFFDITKTVASVGIISFMATDLLTKVKV